MRLAWANLLHDPARLVTTLVGIFPGSKAWELVRVSDEEWDALKQQLRERQRTLLQIINETPVEAFSGNEEMVGGGMATVAHTAFHLGQIRHALRMIGNKTA